MTRYQCEEDSELECPTICYGAILIVALSFSMSMAIVTSAIRYIFNKDCYFLASFLFYFLFWSVLGHARESTRVRIIREGYHR